MVSSHDLNKRNRLSLDYLSCLDFLDCLDCLDFLASGLRSAAARQSRAKYLVELTTGVRGGFRPRSAQPPVVAARVLDLARRLEPLRDGLKVRHRFCRARRARGELGRRQAQQFLNQPSPA